MSFGCLFGFVGLTAPVRAAVIDLSQPVSGSMAPDLVYWKFDETSGAALSNSASSGVGYAGAASPGTYAGATAPYFTPGAYGNALKLPGAGKPDNSYAGPYAAWTGEAGQNALDLVGSDFSGGLWVRFDSVSAAAQTVQILQRGTSSVANSFWISAVRTRNGGAGQPYQWKLQIGVGSTGSAGSAHEVYETGYLDLSAFTEGEWSHVGFSFDYRGDEAGDLKNIALLYLDGVQVGEFEFANSISVSSVQRKLRIGERAASTYYGNFDGAFDDLFLTSGLHTFQPIPEPGSVAMMLGTVLIGGAMAGVKKLGRRKNTLQD